MRYALTVVILTIGVLMQQLIRAERQEAFLEGQRSVYQAWATDGTEGTHYTK